MPIWFQESEKGSWHVPIAGSGNEETVQSWLCIAGSSTCDAHEEDLVNMETSENCHGIYRDTKLMSCCERESIVGCNNKQDSQDSVQNSYNKTTTVGKRKERYPSPS